MNQFFTKWNWRNRILEFIYSFFTLSFATLFLIQIKLWKFDSFTRLYCPRVNLKVEAARLACESWYFKEHVLHLVYMLPVILIIDICLRRLFIRKLFLTY